MRNSFFHITKWLVSLGTELTSVTPQTTLIAVIASLTAQISLLISFLLPLKIIMLMSTEHIPSFFPDELKTLSLNTLVIMLCALTLFFYLVQLFATKITEKTNHSGADKVLKKANKTFLFDNQREIANNAYKQFTGLVSNLTFCLVAFLSLVWLYPEVTVVILIYVTVVLRLQILLCRTRTPFIQLRQSELAFKINSATGAGFFVVFISMVADYLYFTAPNFIIILGSFIISRQLIANIGNIVRQVHALVRNEEKITALFFHHHVLKDSNQTNESPLWKLLINDRSFEWLSEPLNDCLDNKVEELSPLWLDTGIRNIAFFKLYLKSTGKTLLIKIFDQPALSLAKHEESMMTEIGSHHNMQPAILIITTIANLRCHIYEVTDIVKATGQEQWASHVDVLGTLLSFSPSKELRKQYSRSKQTLPERFNLSQLNYLKLTTLGRDDQESITIFEEQFEKLTDILKTIPLSVINPQANQILAVQPDGSESRAKIIHWGKWELEPSGAGWPINQGKFHQFGATLDKVIVSRPELAKIPIAFYELASLTYALERELTKFKFNESIAIIKNINEIIQQQTSKACLI